MASTAQYKCQNCKDLFTARTADRDRGWARFCSKSCKAVKQEKRTGQYASYMNRQSYSNDGDYDGGWDDHKDYKF